MEKALLFLFCLLILFGCGSPVDESDFRNKTFNVIAAPGFERSIDTLLIEFQDTTYTILNNGYNHRLPWRIKKTSKANYLVFFDGTAIIEKLVDGKFYFTAIGETDFENILEERKPKWDRSQLEGVWVSKEYERRLRLNRTDYDPPPPPPPPPGRSFADFTAIPHYELKGDSIYFRKWFFKERSKLEMNKTNEYLWMNIRPISPEGGRINQWHVMSRSDSTLIVEMSGTGYKSKTTIDTLLRAEREHVIVPKKIVEKWDKEYADDE